MKQCPYSKKCSGCQLKNLTYEKQLQMKQVKLIKLLGRFCHVDEIIGMDEPYRYRNKAQSMFFTKNRKACSGIYQSATQSVVPVDTCLLENEKADKIIQTIKKLCSGFDIRPYDMESGRGLLRHVLVRNGHYSNEIMVVIVTTDEKFKSSRSFVNELLRIHPEITTIVRNYNLSSTPLMLGTKSEVLYGEGYIKDSLCGFDFQISPRSFYQVNTVQTEKLYSVAKEYAGLTGNEVVFDAYCGTGTIGITMAKEASRVIGVEINSDAIKDAKLNAKLNSIKNISFYNADAGKLAVEMAEAKEKIDVLITDPPRAGCSIQFLKSVLSLLPKRIVYVSCNPETLARDLVTLTKKHYKVTKIQPVDMFPHTNHVETVVCLTRREKQ